MNQVPKDNETRTSDKKNETHSSTEADRKKDKASTMDVANVADKTDSTHRIAVHLINTGKAESRLLVTFGSLKLDHKSDIQLLHKLGNKHKLQ